MTRRIVVGALWAFAVYSGWQLCTGVLGFGELGIVGAVVSIGVGALIAADPRHRLWDATTPRRVINPADYDTAATGVPASRVQP